MASLNARKHFIMPAFAGIIYNVGIIAGAVLLPGDIMGLAYGVVVGALGHLLVQIPALVRHKAVYTPILTLRDPAVRQVLRLMAPRLLGLSFSELTLFLTTFLTSSCRLSDGFGDNAHRRTYQGCKGHGGSRASNSAHRPPAPSC